MAVFGLVFAEQVLSRVPAVGLHLRADLWRLRAVSRRGRPEAESGASRIPIGSLAGLVAPSCLGAAAGAVLCFRCRPSATFRIAPSLWFRWSTRLAYWPTNVQTFLLPYVHGDISDNTYVGPPFFWEDYGYVGALTFILAFYGVIRERRRPLAVFTGAMTVVAYLLVLGQATPVFHVAYLLVPGLKLFRFPTRFLIVVELGLALLAAPG